MEAAEWLAEDILRDDPLRRELINGKKVISIQRWAEDIDKINRIDLRPWADINRVLRWARSSDFWRGNILSGKKFREKFSDLYMRSATGRREERGAKPAPRPQVVLVNCRECMGDGRCDISSDTLKQCGSFTAKITMRQENSECV